MPQNGALERIERPHILDLVDEPLAPESKESKESMFELVQRLDRAMGVYLEVKQFLAEAHLAEQTCLKELDAIQKSIDNWYAERHLISPVGSHWRKGG